MMRIAKMSGFGEDDDNDEDISHIETGQAMEEFLYRRKRDEEDYLQELERLKGLGRAQGNMEYLSRAHRLDEYYRQEIENLEKQIQEEGSWRNPKRIDQYKSDLKNLKLSHLDWHRMEQDKIRLDQERLEKKRLWEEKVKEANEEARRNRPMSVRIKEYLAEKIAAMKEASTKARGVIDEEEADEELEEQRKIARAKQVAKEKEKARFLREEKERLRKIAKEEGQMFSFARSKFHSRKGMPTKEE